MSPGILVPGQSRENVTGNGASISGGVVLADSGQGLLQIAPL